jgi:pimeloyl-ACP methyl ester carboxylesterase
VAQQAGDSERGIGLLVRRGAVVRDVTTFVFVHGAWHGGWCWSRLLPEMEARGHRSVVMDLPVEDGNATFEDYAEAVLASYPADLEQGMLVGHSLGAMVLPLVAASRPASLLVFLCGVLPNLNGRPWNDAPPMARPDAYRTETLDDGSSVFATFESARLTFYADCDPEDARWAFQRLRAQNSRSLWDRPYPLRRLPPTPRAAIAALDDAAVTIEFSRAVTRPRLGVDLVEIPGDHSPFLGRPRELADLLDRLARNRGS